jgi:hypothetical protein
VLHVHHAPSHDSDAPFEAVRDAAQRAGLDFVVLTEHVPDDAHGPLPGADRIGRYPYPDEREPGRELLVMAGGEFGTHDGHLVGYDLPRAIPTRGMSGAEAVDAIHAAGGFAVVPHPFRFGGWGDWDSDFDGIEVSSHAVALREELGPLVPFRLLRLAFSRDAAMRARMTRPHRELERWDGIERRVVAFQAADAHQNVSLLGWQIDRYDEIFAAVHTRCPDGPLEAASVWRALREGRCRIRYAIFDDRADEVERVVLLNGRVELQLDGGRRVLEIHQRPD